MAMRDLEMETTMDIVNKMGVAILHTADIAPACLLLRLKMSVDEHGTDTETTDQTPDYPRDHRQQIIRAMMDRENVQMVIDLDPVIWTEHLHEAEPVALLLTPIFQATGLTADDEMIDLHVIEMTALEDAMTEMTAVTRIEIESVIVTGWTMTNAAEADEPEVAVEAQSEIASETESGIENHWRELMSEIEISIVDEGGQVICWIFSATKGVSTGRERDSRYWGSVVIAWLALNARLELSFVCMAFGKD